MKCPGAGPHSYVIHYGTQKCLGWGGQATNEHSLCPGNIKIDTQDMQHLWNIVLSLLSGGRSIAGSLSANGSDAMFTWLALFNLWGWPHCCPSVTTVMFDLFKLPHPGVLILYGLILASIYPTTYYAYLSIHMYHWSAHLPSFLFPDPVEHHLNHLGML